MSLINKFLAFFLVTWALVSRASCDTAYSHVFQSTPDYTISHKHFHDHAALASPFLLSKTQPEPSSSYSPAAYDQNIGQQYENQPVFYSAQEQPRDTVPVKQQYENQPGFYSAQEQPRATVPVKQQYENQPGFYSAQEQPQATVPVEQQYENQPGFYSAQGQPRATVSVEQQKQDDLPPGYTSLPAMINVPPGYQLVRGNSEYYYQ